MKTPMLAAITAALTLLAVTSFCAEQKASQAGMIDFAGSILPNVLEVYKAITKLEMITDSRVKTLHTPITLKTERPVSKEEGTKLIEKAVLEQAGIVITHLDDKRVSVTFNDALPINGADKHSKK
jgi:hypothetical protein